MYLWQYETATKSLPKDKSKVYKIFLVQNKTKSVFVYARTAVNVPLIILLGCII